jgi:hypothetical protein
MRYSIRIFSIVWSTFAFVALIWTTVEAQYLISSEAGFINRAEGESYITQRGKKDDERVRATPSTQMQDGDRLNLEAGSKMEILLNPGSYLRATENTEIRAVNTSLYRIRFEVIKGSVIIEAGEIDKQTQFEIITPHGLLFITKKGLHRIDTKADLTIVAARQGEIYLGTREQVLGKQAFKIGRGKLAQLTGNSTMALAKLNPDAVDDFDAWSLNRAETIVAANNGILIRSRNQGSLASGWLYDPQLSTYTYIPRKRLYFSPYGFGFFNTYNRCYCCYFGFNNFGFNNFGYFGPHWSTGHPGHRGKAGHGDQHGQPNAGGHRRH